jgi:hypothetical protein
VTEWRVESGLREALDFDWEGVRDLADILPKRGRSCWGCTSVHRRLLDSRWEPDGYWQVSSTGCCLCNVEVHWVRLTSNGWFDGRDLGKCGQRWDCGVDLLNFEAYGLTVVHSYWECLEDALVYLAESSPEGSAASTTSIRASMLNSSFQKFNIDKFVYIVFEEFPNL